MISGCSSTASLVPTPAPVQGKESAADQFHSLTTRMLGSRTIEVLARRFSFSNQMRERLNVTITAEGMIDLSVLPLPPQVDQVNRSMNPHIHALTTAADWFAGAECDLRAVKCYDVTLIDRSNIVTLWDWSCHVIDQSYEMRAWNEEGSVIEHYGFSYQTVPSVIEDYYQQNMVCRCTTVVMQDRFARRTTAQARIPLPFYFIPRMTLDHFSTLVNSIAGAAPSLPKALCGVIADFATSCFYMAISNKEGEQTKFITLFRISLWDVGLNGRLDSLRARQS